MTASGKGAGVTSGIIFGGFCCLGLILLAIAATVVLSLIGIYTPNHSEQGYGEEYRLNAILLKTIYTNSTSLSFKNGSVATSTDLSALCGTVYRTTGPAKFAGCVARNFKAVGPTNASTVTTKRRRRQASIVENGIILVGEISLFHTSSCGKASDKLHYSNNSKLTSCVKRRLAACNTIATATTWMSPPTTLGLSIVDSFTFSYVRVTLTRLFSLSNAAAVSLATNSNLGLTPTQQSYLSVGCQYVGPRSLSYITAALASQSSETTTQPSSTNPVG